MTIQDVLARVDELKPNNFSEEQKVRWLSNLDLMLYEEVVRWHKGTEDIAHGPYDPEDDLAAELMVPDPHSDIYILWLTAQIDYYNGDLHRYQNSMIAYNTALSAYADWFNRRNMPTAANLKVYGG